MDKDVSGNGSCGSQRFCEAASPSAGGLEKSVEAALVIDSQNLFAHGREITIRHGQELYRLRITRNDKLILTK